jgi:[acyl-carrier-protein] S-malonyltransferase
MRPAAENLQNYIEKTELKFTPPKIPLLHNVDVAMHTQHEEIKAALVKQLFQPVRWVDTIQAMVSADVNCMIECGPGKVLSGLNRRIERSIQCFALETEAGFKQADEKKLDSL